MRQTFYKLFDAQTAVGTQTSGKLDTRQVYSISVIISSSDGSNAGTLKLQGSNAPTGFGNVAMDFTPPTASWVDIPNATVTVATGETDVISVLQHCYAWTRAVWTPSAGAGTITVETNTQGF